MSVHNGRRYLDLSLPALRNSDHPDFEVIVVDDYSSDFSAQFAATYADKVIEKKIRQGPSIARNEGAMVSKGKILLFLDADVMVQRNTLSRVVDEFQKHPDVGALFGSYDDRPLHMNFFSQYKNLFHHFIHQHSKSEASTFWAGCGAIKRDVFFGASGYAGNYRAPSIEDVDFGYRIKKRDQKIRLVKDLQVRHLKKWTFLSLLKTDLFRRVIPWTKLAVKRGLPNDLNFKYSDRLSGALILLSAVSCVTAFRWSGGKYLTFGCVLMLLTLNRTLYLFFLKKRGVLFAFAAVFYHWFYLLYSTVFFSVSYLFFSISRSNKRQKP